MNDRISKNEIRKDAAQDALTAAAGTVGTVATIVTSAVTEVVKAVGGLANEVFEIRDAARKAVEQDELADPS